MSLPARIVERINKHSWPEQVGETKIVSPYSFGRGTIEHDFLYPDGKTMSFQSWDPKDIPSIVLPITENGMVIVVVQYCHAVMKPLIELPGGVRDNLQESSYDVAFREVIEETKFKSGKIVSLGPVYWEPHNNTMYYEAFLALNCKEVETTAELDESESLFVELLTWAEWLAVCQDPNLVRDNKSLAVTFLAMPYLNDTI